MLKTFTRPFYWAILYAVTCGIFITEALFAEKLNYFFDFVGLGGTFYPHNLKIFGLSAYWALMLVGFGVALWICYKNRDTYGLGRWAAAIIPLGFFATSFAGAKLLYLLEQQTIYKHNPTLTMDGLSLFGAIFLVPMVAALVGFSKKLSRPQLLDLCALLGLIMLVFVRTGCFINGCCDSPLTTCNGRPFRLPIQLIEVILDLVMIEVCLFVRKKTDGSGWMYPTFAIGYGAYRFVLEFFRDTPKWVGGFTHSQLWAVLCMLMGVTMVLCMRHRTKREQNRT